MFKPQILDTKSLTKVKVFYRLNLSDPNPLCFVLVVLQHSETRFFLYSLRTVRMSAR